MTNGQGMISMRFVLMGKDLNFIVVARKEGQSAGGRAYMIKNGDGVVTTLGGQPSVDGLLSVVGDHHIHSQLCQLSNEWTQQANKKCVGK